MDYIEVDLMPIGIKKQMRTIKIVGSCAEIAVFAFLIVLWTSRSFHDIPIGIIFSSAVLLITTPLLLPGFMFDKVSQSTVRFSEEGLSILDKKGVCWRSICYGAITDVRIENVSGFFYGHNKDMFQYQYVCLFLNGSTDIPHVSFAKLFNERDLIMFGYHAEALHWIRQKCLHKEGEL